MMALPRSSGATREFPGLSRDVPEWLPASLGPQVSIKEEVEDTHMMLVSLHRADPLFCSVVGRR